jgi:hypothetical protein
VVVVMMVLLEVVMMGMATILRDLNEMLVTPNDKARWSYERKPCLMTAIAILPTKLVRTAPKTQQNDCADAVIGKTVLLRARARQLAWISA